MSSLITGFSFVFWICFDDKKSRANFIFSFSLKRPWTNLQMISKVVTLPAIHFLFINTYILIYSNYSKSAICILQPFFLFLSLQILQKSSRDIKQILRWSLFVIVAVSNVSLLTHSPANVEQLYFAAFKRSKDILINGTGIFVL